MASGQEYQMFLARFCTENAANVAQVVRRGSDALTWLF